MSTLKEICKEQTELLNECRQNIKGLTEENKVLRLQSDTYFNEWQEAKKNYITLTDHIRLKASANPGEHRYIALVNFIDRLERD
ncbi:hypothetical protein [Staphylococcus succinus]|uniref:hypothetical protein n=1 Tax=Staphylococcus succinus TaxID=61015 RepID=UPI000936216F|nr:hypothetical protein [Staphylococcus succinus]